jgi:hypothetical protein
VTLPGGARGRGRTAHGCITALAVALATPAFAAPHCVPAQRVVERFIAADCDVCWTRSGPRLPATTWALDWIAPAGTDAALSAAALPEAASRLQALALATSGGTAEVERPLPASPVRLSVAGGPAWNGYLGLELRSRGKPPSGSTAYVALVEVLAAGEEGSAVERHLLRAVAGPLVLDATGRPSTQLRALRIPEGAKPERLRGMAWWVDGQAQLRGLVREGCPASPR